MHSPTTLLTELLSVKLLLHLSIVLRLLHCLLIAHHESDLADLLGLHSQALDKLLTRLLIAAKTAESHSVMQ